MDMEIDLSAGGNDGGVGCKEGTLGGASGAQSLQQETENRHGEANPGS